ncbi:MAG: lipid-A-disaccharide synthase, partial [Candidatus Omnitrophota bacterium]|nr:lipid-A-disaccharide synthase [Candidatus Omnitrophota bacterium]
MMSKKILIVAGEPSGDLHASNLVNNLNTLRPGLKFFGIGGSLLKKAGAEIVFDITPLALVGLIEVLSNIFTVGKVYKDILRKIDVEKPDLAILVDYPGFNLRLAKELKARSIPAIYYISPQVWAWGRSRVKIIKRCVKKIIVLFKFEEELYKTYGIDAEFVG